MAINILIRKTTPIVFLALAAIALQACTSDETVYPRQRSAKGGATYEENQSVFGEGGVNLFGDSGGTELPGGAEGGGGIGVNSYLWRASLDTISFMPLSSADPFGGVIITDWYSPPESQAERFKVNLYILGRDLRADGIRAAVFRQQSDSAGAWIDANVDAKTAVDLENAILTRARQLRIAGLQ